jgi:cardiolipin synthase
MPDVSAYWLAALLLFYWVYRTFLLGYPKFRVDEALDLNDPDTLRIISSLSNALVFQKNRIEPLNDGKNFYPAQLTAIRKAKHSVNLEVYTFFPEEIGREFAEALSERARAGVQVRLLLDAFGAGRMGRRRQLLNELRAAGCKVGFYHPLRHLSTFNTRTHREIYVMDGKVAFVGGAGIANQWIRRSRNQAAWRDLMFRIEGPAVAGIQGVFLENWSETCDEIPTNRGLFPDLKPEGDATALVVNSVARMRSSPARALHQVLIASATATIRISSPYFLPDPSVRRELTSAARRGVDVRIVTTGKNTDHALTRAGSRRLYGDLLKAGAKIYEYHRSMYHVKLLIVDGKWAVGGTTNFDNRSFAINDEICIAIPNEALIEQLEAQFARDVEASHRITLKDWKRRSVFERLHAQLSRFVERQQ